MLNDFTAAEKIYLACGYTDLRRGIDDLASMVQQQFRWLMEGLNVEQPKAHRPARNMCVI